MFALKRFERLLAVAGAVVLLGTIGFGLVARGAQPPPDAEPGSVGFQSAILGGIDSAVASGYRLVLAEVVLEPGAYATSHTHPTAIVVCVQSGALGFALQHGAATVTRSAGAGTPAPTEPLAPGGEVMLQPRDCIAFDHFAAHTAHTGWNAGEGQTVLWEARLFKIDEPFTTFLDELGTPVP
jgi:hypothetical protein